MASGSFVGTPSAGPLKWATAQIASATTDGALVTAVAGSRLRVYGFILSCAGTATTVTFNSKPAGAGTAVSATFQLGANGQLFVPIATIETVDGYPGWFQSAAGEGLTVTTGTGSTVGVHVVYGEVPA